MALGDDRPVIFLEDDCEFTSGMTALWAKVAEERILTIDAISFGAVMNLSVPVTNDWIRVFRGGSTHGMLLSPGGMAIILELPFTGLAHDALLYERLRLDTPRWPAAVQRHYRTKNSFVYDPWGMTTLWDIIVYKTDSDPQPKYILEHIKGSIGGNYVLITAFLVAALVSITYKYHSSLSLSPARHNHSLHGAPNQ